MNVFINNRNLLTWPRAMAELLWDQGHYVTIVDNASTYAPLIDWYDNEWKRPVIRLRSNEGPRAPWVVMGKQLEPYVVTDPDLDISAVPADWPEVLLAGVWLRGVKCGLSIEDRNFSSLSIGHGMGDVFGGHEGWEGYRDDTIWGKPIGHLFFDFPVDTTFAVYDPEIDCHRIGGCRVAAPYQAIHLPWHIVLEVDHADPSLQVPMTDEYANYLKTVETGATVASFKTAKEMCAAFSGRKEATCS